MLEERRHHQCIDVDFPAIVRGIACDGKRFEQQTYICSLSTTGLHMRPLQNTVPGTTLFVVFRFASDWTEPGITFAALGLMKEIEVHADGSRGVDLTFSRYRCLEAA